MLSDLAKVALKSIPTIRVYGTDCNYLSTIYPIATSFGLKINQGFWFNSPDTTSTIEAANLLVAYCQQNGWDVIDFITVGNEVINESYLTPAQLASVISTVGDILKQGGYTGDITTSEPPVSFERYPELCDADIDFVGINPHSYFDVSISASQAGTFVLGQKQIVENICKNKEVRITETGYPSKGNTNGLNVPSADNQRAAIKSILEVVGSDVTILTMYNDLWKQPGSYNVEQWFGAYDLLS